MVQRCRGGGEVQRSREVAAGAEVQRWCRGGAEVVESPGTQVVSAEVVCGAEVQRKLGCRGAEVMKRCSDGCRGDAEVQR